MIAIDKKTLIIIAGIVLIGAIAGYVFRGVPNPGSGADAVRANLSAAGQQQQAAIDRLSTIENGLDASAAKAGTISAGLGDTAKSIATVESRIDSSEAKLTDSAELIAEGQRILATVRARGQSGTN
jgi:peptidoglycan hydrolase CwlO-like protein